jgi:diacylglycerol kinase (ATP)
MNFSLLKRLHSFRHAFRGVKYLVISQHNAWIHAVATIAVVVLGLSLKISSTDWRWVTVAIALVWMAEAFNTALEVLADEVSQEHRVRIGLAKDAAAGGVLIAALGAVIIGIFVFLPYIAHA